MENITEKIDLFRQGYIKEGINYISYDTAFHDSLYNIINLYWDTDTQYKYNFLTEEDLQNIYPIPQPSFDMSSYVITSGDLEIITGIDFADDYGITGLLVGDFVSRLNSSITTLTTSMASSVSGLTGNIVIPGGNVPSDGIVNLTKANIKFLDYNDVQTYYSDKLDIILTASKVTTPDIKNSILLDILDKSKLISKRLTTCNNNSLLYCKHPNSIIEQICIDNLSAVLTYQQSINFAKALNSIMPTDPLINSNHSNKDLLDTAKILIDEIDIVKKAIKVKGI